MITELDILTAACGADEGGYGKAVVLFENKIMNFETKQQKIFEDMTLNTPVLNIFRDMRHTMVDVMFENASDYDLIQLFNMLKRFTDIKNMKDLTELEVPSIQLTIIPNEYEGQFFITAFHGSWVLTSSQANRLPNTIRFIFDNDTFNVYSMTDTGEAELEEAEEVANNE